MCTNSRAVLAQISESLFLFCTNFPSVQTSQCTADLSGVPLLSFHQQHSVIFEYHCNFSGQGSHAVSANTGTHCTGHTGHHNLLCSNSTTCCTHELNLVPFLCLRKLFFLLFLKTTVAPLVAASCTEKMSQSRLIIRIQKLYY